MSALRRLLSNFLPAAVLGYAQRLRFPYLFLLSSVLFVVDLLVPDFVPFFDELLLGLLTLLLARIKRRKDEL